MSRAKRFAHSLVSGYAVVGTNIVYTLASVPLALHYLSKGEIGLWALALQVTGYLQLVDLGMAGSISRILIDHKDSPGDGVYGAIIKTGALVLVVQGVIIALGGGLLSLVLPGLLGVPAIYHSKFQVLIAGQCLMMGVSFVGRMSGHVLQAHQRYDAVNYSQIGTLLSGLAVLWLGFAQGWGVYSLLASYVASSAFGTVFSGVAMLHLKLLPPAGSWGVANKKTFKELFAYGREIFMITVGWQLVNASQIVVISRTLGLDAAAVWSIATKPFMLAQQLVFRLLDFSAAGLAEMIVRRERERLLARFRDLVILSASLAVGVGFGVALCNHDFLILWTKGEISWSRSSDMLMGLLVVAYSTTRCYIGFVGMTKEIRSMKYIYFLEGLAFVILSLLIAPKWGMNGIIGCALVTNLLCSGVYGFWRTKEYFAIGRSSALLSWLRGPSMLFAGLALVLAMLWGVGGEWNSVFRLCLNAVSASLTGLAMFWWLGLNSELRAEAAGWAVKLRSRFRR